MTASTTRITKYESTEEIHVSSEDSNRIRIRLKTDATIVEHPDEQHSGIEGRRGVQDTSGTILLHPADAILRSILNNFNLDSLSISIASSSSSSSSIPLSRYAKTFPVGTAVQFSVSEVGGGNSDDNKNDNDGYSHAGIEYELVRLLQSKNLLCDNVQLEAFHMGLIHPFSLPNWKPHEKIDNDPSSSKVLMLPNDAFALCHSNTLMERIISSSPCRDSLGIYSQFHTNWNEMSTVDRAMWIHVRRVLPALEGDGQKMIDIERGVQFSRHVTPSAQSITMGSLLGIDGEGEQLDHCPLTTSSRIVVEAGEDGGEYDDIHNTEATIYDLKRNSMDMQQPIMQFNDDDEQRTRSRFGIERNTLRFNGVSNRGMMQTRVYHHTDGEESLCSDGSALTASVLDVYPHFVSPLYHSIKLLLLEGNGAGDEFSTIDSSINPPLSGEGYNITRYALTDFNHSLSLLPDGTGSLSIAVEIPQDSSLYIQLEYKPKFLSFEQFPPDPNRGFDVPPSIATFRCPLRSGAAQGKEIMHEQTLYSNALLIMPPVPDLSMPYNIISITCTFFALIIGVIVNITIRKANETVNDTLKGIERKPPLARFKEMLQTKFATLRSKVRRKKAACQDSSVSTMEPVERATTTKDKVE